MDVTTPTLKLSDLAGPDASGFSDVAVIVRADGSESEPFVVLDNSRHAWQATLIHKVSDNSPYWSGWEGKTVRRLGRGRLVPARIEMEGEATADFAAHGRLLRAALEPFATHAVPCAGQPCPWCDARLAMMATEGRP